MIQNDHNYWTSTIKEVSLSYERQYNFPLDNGAKEDLKAGISSSFTALVNSQAFQAKAAESLGSAISSPFTVEIQVNANSLLIRKPGTENWTSILPQEGEEKDTLAGISHSILQKAQFVWDSHYRPPEPAPKPATQPSIPPQPQPQPYAFPPQYMPAMPAYYPPMMMPMQQPYYYPTPQQPQQQQTQAPTAPSINVKSEIYTPKAEVKKEEKKPAFHFVEVDQPISEEVSKDFPEKEDEIPSEETHLSLLSKSSPKVEDITDPKHPKLLENPTLDKNFLHSFFPNPLDLQPRIFVASENSQSKPPTLLLEAPHEKVDLSDFVSFVRDTTLTLPEDQAHYFRFNQAMFKADEAQSFKEMGVDVEDAQMQELVEAIKEEVDRGDKMNREEFQGKMQFFTELANRLNYIRINEEDIENEHSIHQKHRNLVQSILNKQPNIANDLIGFAYYLKRHQEQYPSEFAQIQELKESIRSLFLRASLLRG